MKVFLRWIVMIPLSYAFTFLAFLVGPLLPLFAQMRDGPADNANKTAIEPRLPGWLLDVYIKDPLAIHRQPRAPFLCQPHIRPAK